MSSAVFVYGIPNCDTVKKSRAWFDAQAVAYVFHDFKKQGVPRDELRKWIEALGWEALLNKKGTTWRKLSAEAQAAVIDAESATTLMMSNASVIKRPVVKIGAKFTVGLVPELWS
jgi:arsenate reductase (glutaredoxin)